MKINVLLTGAGGNLAHFIHRALLASKLDIRVVACDYSADAVGLYEADVGYVVPPAKDADYQARILSICQTEQIHIIMVGGMVEMRLLAQSRDLVRQQTGAFVVTSDLKVLQTMEDKFALARHLASHGFDHPDSVLPGNATEFAEFLQRIPYPYIVKDRFGGGSQGLGIAHTPRQLEWLVETIPNAVVQEYLYPDDEEYTVGVFVGTSGKAVASIVMKRQLGLGMTFKAQVLADSALGSYCERVLETMGALGPINVQLRLTPRGPVVFEINPRFSSTTSARAHYGYNEPEMCIRHFVLQETLKCPQLTGGRFFRVIEDVFVEEADFLKVKAERMIRK